MLILVTNDDGIHAPGLAALAKALKGLGRIVIVAPDREQSAVSHALTLHRPLRIAALGPQRYAVDGTPADCVTLGILEILKKKPDLIVSGVNFGGNMGNDVHYSGTVSAAIEGVLMKIPSVAVSLVAENGGHPYFETAARVTRRVIPRLMPILKARPVAININVPNRPYGRLCGLHLTELGQRDYGDILFKKIDPRGKKYYWISGDRMSFAKIKGTDCVAVGRGQVSITPLRVDLTDHMVLKELQTLKL